LTSPSFILGCPGQISEKKFSTCLVMCGKNKLYLLRDNAKMMHKEAT